MKWIIGLMLTVAFTLIGCKSSSTRYSEVKYTEEQLTELNQAEGPLETEEVKGIVFDKETGLYWQKCVKGQNAEDDCSGKAEPLNWEDAKSYCANLQSGDRTWRLPTIDELRTIRDDGIWNWHLWRMPAIDKSAFPRTKAGFHWSISPVEGKPEKAQMLCYRSGGVLEKKRTMENFVRCVSGP